MVSKRKKPKRPPSRLRIRAEREARGWTLEDLAERLGVARQTIGRWETEERDVGVAALFAIASAMDIPVRLLLPGDDGLSEDERMLMDIFRAAPPHEKRGLLTMAKTLHEGRQPAAPARIASK